MTARKEGKGWAVVNLHGDVIVSTVASTRVESIKAMVGSANWRPPWRQWKQWGSRCVKVRIVSEVEND